MSKIFPDVLATTYIPNSVPVIKSGDLMAFQKEIVQLWRALRYHDFLHGDDFMGLAVDTGLWATTGAVSTLTVESPAPSNDAFGVLDVDPSAADALLGTRVFQPRTLNWRYATAARFPNYTSRAGISDSFLGLRDTLSG